MLENLQKIINDYTEENGKIFEFEIIDNKIYLKKYYQKMDLNVLELPNFISGFSRSGNIFPETSKFTHISISSNLEDLSFMFYKSKIKKVDLSNLDVSKVKNMSYMFYKSYLKDVGNLSEWDTSNVSEMSSMFYGSTIKKIEGMQKWNLNSVKNVSYMFYDSKLDDVGEISEWDTSNISNMTHMFYNSKLLNLGDIKSQWKLTNLKHSPVLITANSEIEPF